ncbi:MAG: DegT/DnrJ/EryC1/StrS family aminotransferase, partial [Pedosphaera sp.]|nr:DegT/DnrJ/EryC1/StrS family aminotransferase [Pedosphaera sp.]
MNPDFIFAYPAYNVRGTELNAVIGRNQLKRLDDNNAIRTRNLKLFLNGLDPAKYQTDFAVEGGMVCTNDDELYEAIRIYRSHGMVREAAEQKTKDRYQSEYPDLNPDFIFAYPAYNVRGTELNAVIGRNQLKRLDDNNA